MLMESLIASMVIRIRAAVSVYYEFPFFLKSIASVQMPPACVCSLSYPRQWLPHHVIKMLPKFPS
jgi:hypothetical protein